MLPCEHLNLSATDMSIPPILKTYHSTLKDPHWFAAMHDEYNALLQNSTWPLVPPSNANVVSRKWIYCHKYNPDGSLSRYKAHWVLCEFSQLSGIDFYETFSLVIQPATIRIVSSLALSHSWPIHQMDVKNDFLHDTLDEVVYSQQSAGFVDPSNPCHV